MNNSRIQKLNKTLVFLVILICLFASGSGSPPIARAQAAGFHISGRYVLDANGNNFIMRGINVPHNWYPEQTSQFQHTKAKGANTVRVVLSSGQNWPKNSASDVSNVINLCKTNKLVCVLEVHDTTGYGEVAGATTLAQAVTYWKEIQSVLTGQEAYVIINLGNEPYGNNNATGWINATKNAIAEMRTAGFQHLLMVDAPNWGQDWEFIMRDNATSVFNSDPLKNIVFSIHMYGVFEQAAAVQAYVSSFVNAGLPLVIGEFGHEHSDGNPHEDAIMSTAQSNGIGYLGWMWSGGGYLDMVTDFDPNQETVWGNRIIHGVNGIVSTSQEASIYSSSVPTISGNVGANGATLSYTDDLVKTVIADSSGNYSITIPHGWDGTVTPSHTCFTFSPTSLSYSNVIANQTAQNFNASFNSASGCADIDVLIAGSNMGSYGIAPGKSLREGYPGIDNGPIKIDSMNGVNIVAALRVIWREPGVRFSYSEMMGLPKEQLSSEYWFPWYNNAAIHSMDQGFRIANVDTASGNTVEVWVGTTRLDLINLAAGGSTRVGYNIDNGPIRIVCTTCTNTGNDKIIAALRVIWKEPRFRASYSEMMGLPKEQLSNEYWFPWYNNASINSMDQGFRIANVDTAAGNTVEVWVGGIKLETINLGPGSSTRVGYNVDNGPARIVCTTCTNIGNDKIITALRVIWKEPGFRASYSEMMGLPKEQLSNEYWFPWYNNLAPGSMDQGFRIANLDSTTHTIQITVGATPIASFPLGPSVSTRVGYLVDNGPIRIVCTTCTNPDDKIIPALRVIWREPGYRSSYSEMMGLPVDDLSTEYWFPWYNNKFPTTTMDQGFRIAVP
jgi:mannan endo-1,4-beta-mannosidase